MTRLPNIAGSYEGFVIYTDTTCDWPLPASFPLEITFQYKSFPTTIEITMDPNLILLNTLEPADIKFEQHPCIKISYATPRNLEGAMYNQQGNFAIYTPSEYGITITTTCSPYLYMSLRIVPFNGHYNEQSHKVDINGTISIFISPDIFCKYSCRITGYKKDKHKIE